MQLIMALLYTLNFDIQSNPTGLFNLLNKPLNSNQPSSKTQKSQLTHQNSRTHMLDAQMYRSLPQQ